jgi:hypothetical protein
MMTAKPMLAILTLAVAAAPAHAGSAGTMSSAELNSAHDPRPVRQWLSGYLLGAVPDVVIGGRYQIAAAEIGQICYRNPYWTLGMAARLWVHTYRMDE